MFMATRLLCLHTNTLSGNSFDSVVSIALLIIIACGVINKERPHAKTNEERKEVRRKFAGDRVPRRHKMCRSQF